MLIYSHSLVLPLRRSVLLTFNRPSASAAEQLQLTLLYFKGPVASKSTPRLAAQVVDAYEEHCKQSGLRLVVTRIPLDSILNGIQAPGVVVAMRAAAVLAAAMREVLEKPYGQGLLRNAASGPARDPQLRLTEEQARQVGVPLLISCPHTSELVGMWRIKSVSSLSPQPVQTPIVALVLAAWLPYTMPYAKNVASTCGRHACTAAHS
jgi:hypothetical protein